ncbi:hypothetical protein, partial [Roseateles sp.]|uniref:hypothetical protein n=1 Tax=Roseateles sp. TaxID=1971397 RepID=UPI00326665AF
GATPARCTAGLCSPVAGECSVSVRICRSAFGQASQRAVCVHKLPLFAGRCSVAFMLMDAMRCDALICGGISAMARHAIEPRGGK